MLIFIDFFINIFLINILSIYIKPNFIIAQIIQKCFLVIYF